MNKSTALFLIVALSISVWTSAVGQGALVSQNELRQLAENRPRIKQTVDELLKQTPASALEQLKNLSLNQKIMAVESDAIVYGYAMSLRQRPQPVGARELLSWLEQYPVQRWRLHEESATYQVPVFDVATAIAGTQNEWRYRDAQQELFSVTSVDDHRVLKHYSHPPHRQYRAAVEANVSHLSRAQAENLQQQLSSHPTLARSPLAAKLALSQHDEIRLAEMLQQAPAAVSIMSLRELPAYFDSQQVLELCQRALGHKDSSVHAVALASATPLLNDNPQQRRQWIDIMVARLTDPAAGSAAALQLSKVIDEKTLSTLNQAAAKQPLLKQRIQLIQRLRQRLSMVTGENAS